MELSTEAIPHLTSPRPLAPSPLAPSMLSPSPLPSSLGKLVPYSDGETEAQAGPERARVPQSGQDAGLLYSAWQNGGTGVGKDMLGSWAVGGGSS